MKTVLTRSLETGGATPLSYTPSLGGQMLPMVWTDTTLSGTQFYSYDCDDWTNPNGYGAFLGEADNVQSGSWTLWCQAGCNTLAALYCFEQ